MGRIINRRRVMGSYNSKTLEGLIDGSISGTFVVPNVTIIRTSAFAYCRSLTSITIPDSVTSIGDGAFSACSGLTSVNLPQNLTAINSGIFSGCGSLVNIEIPDSVTAIYGYAFDHCRITTLTIPDSVLYIYSDNAVADCPNLESVIIGRGIKSIGSYAFIRCYNLKEVTILATTPPTINTTVFSNNHAERKFYVPAESLEAYKTANVWKNYADVIFPIEE